MSIAVSCLAPSKREGGPDGREGWSTSGWIADSTFAPYMEQVVWDKLDRDRGVVTGPVKAGTIVTVCTADAELQKDI
jgi:hypothetical protein